MNQRIVNLRALAIILIVLGHSIIIYDRSFDLLKSDIAMPMFETVKHFISFIQLKLFFSISGFLMFYKINNYDNTSLSVSLKSVVQIFGDKFYRLLVPFFCVCVIWMDPIKIILGVKDYDLSWNLILQQLQFSNCGHLWFLPCLFIIFIIMYILLVLIRQNILGLTALFFILAYLNYIYGRFPETFQIQNVAYYIYYFYLGYLINYLGNRYEIGYKRFHIKYLIGFITILFLIGYFIYKITSIGFDFYLSSLVVILCYILIPNNSTKIVAAISKNSYGIYLFHSPMIYITALCCPNINPWMMLFINFFVFGGVAYAMTDAISKSKFRFLVGLYLRK